MNADERRFLNQVAERVIGAAFEVSNLLGSGFLEKVYQGALAEELRLRGVQVIREHPLPVTYKGRIVGEYFVDLLVEQKVIVELKCVEHFADEHLAQCLNYLKASNLQLALLINFQKPRVEIRRVVRNF